MPQPTSPASAPTAPAAPAASAAPAQPTAGGLTRTDGVVSGNAPAPSVTGTATSQPGGPTPLPAQQQQGMPPLMWMFILLPVALIAMTVLTNRKEQKKRKDLMGSLQRNDKVQTIGGVIGRIAEINENEVVLHVDEVTKTRVCVSRQAISTVLNRAGNGAKAEAKATA